VKGSVFLVTSLAACTVFLSCNADRKPARASAPAAAAATVDTFNLVGSEWLLEELAGSGVIDNARATLSSPEAGKVSGNGSCNRFFGPAEVARAAVKLGPFGSTRMACPEVAMNQETKYLNALQAAERYQWRDPSLLVYCKGFDKPLRFTRVSAPAATTP
jgi:heat shock protein HslJ